MDALLDPIKKLGFGLMRLPMRGEEIDIEQTAEMADLFLAHGFTYFDTAYGYNNGKSEAAMKQAVVDRHPRDSFLLATKLPAWAGAKNRGEAEQMFFTSLERTGAGYFDMYLLHNLGGGRTEIFDEYRLWEFVEKQKALGYIRHFGFSFHDKADALEAVLKAHPEAEFVQLQINYADWENTTVESRKCYEVAEKYGKPVIVMEPIRGGVLANPPEAVRKLFAAADSAASPAQWALRFAASLQNARVVLSGMSNIEQMRENISFMEAFAPLTEAEQTTVAAAREALSAIPSIPCTACAYCKKGCPQGINIPQLFFAMNNLLVLDSLAAAKGEYHWATMAGGKASDCIACGQCEGVCPQHIAIIEELRRIAETLEA